MPATISLPSRDAAGNALSNPFQEQLAFFQRKLNLPTDRYDDILKSAHDRAFIVAGAANADLLNDLRAAIEKGIADGTGYGAFRKQFDAIVLKHGWTGWTGEGSAAGHAWRTQVIYQTNMATSYAAGRWQQLKNPDLLAVRPYWRYVHADGVLHPRPLHVSWDGLVLPHDHEFWMTHFPPNGWGCHCRVVAVSAKEYAKAQAEGRGVPPDGWDSIDPKTQAPVGIDKGWNYAPGANASRPMQDFIDEKLVNLSAPIGAAMYQALLPVLRKERNAAYESFIGTVLADPIKRGRHAIVGALDSATLQWLATHKGIYPASAEIAVLDGLIVGKKAARHTEAGNALSQSEWMRLPELLERPERIVFDTRTGKLIYIVASADPLIGKLAVEFDYKAKKSKGEMNLLVSAFRVLSETIAGDIASGVLRVVK
jgi:hypothetical protein